MMSRQLWITVGTAVVSFALGLALAPSLRKSDAGAISEIRQTKSGDRTPSGTLSGDAREITSHNRVGKRDEKTKNTEPRISIPLSTVEKRIKDQPFDSDFMYLSSFLERDLPYLGATDAEAAKLMNSLKQAQTDLLTGERNLLKVVQTDKTRIQLDTSAMQPVYASAIQRFQDDIRSTLSPEAANLLISSIDWNQFYPAGKESSPIFKIIRRTSGEVAGVLTMGDIVKWYMIPGDFADDGKPIPADSGFDHWKPYLKGLTLLPQNEK
ncbi:MAG: hypothetical protein ABIS50_23270 [Luteolibacter sp.]|uniref:hypothetical protein n=1 Tax=Luteolibacter sp. TaxID=1962973 RepID=UPI0032642743